MLAKLIKIKDDPILPQPKYLHLPQVYVPDTQTYAVSVEDPKKVGDKNAYVSYTVRCTRKAENSSTLVTRRYSDFEWLCEHLKIAHPSCVVPQVPEKSLSGNFDEGLMAFRARELTRFLQRILSHPVLSSDDAVQFFIGATEEDFAQRRAQKDDKEGFFASLKRAASTALGAPDDPDTWFADKANEVLSREVLLTQMLQVVQRMILQYQGLSRTLVEHVASLRAFAESTDEGSLKTCIENNINGLEQTKELIDDMVCELTVTVSGNILDYIHELQAINGLIERRIPLVRAYTSASKEGGEDTSKSDEAKNQLTQFSNAARADIQQACDLRNGDMERFFAAISSFSQEFCSLMSNRWDAVLGNEPTGPAPAATAGAIDEAEGAFKTTTTTTTTSSNPFGDI